MEYIIVNGGKFISLTGKDVSWTGSLNFASKFKSKERAAALARKAGGRVDAFWGAAIPAGAKQMVAPKQSPINGHSAYRSI